MAEADLSNFSELRQKYVHDIAQNLDEAHSLMIKLNRNLRVWAERTGELESFDAVWTAFQRRLASLSAALADVEEEHPGMQESPEPRIPTSPDLEGGAGDRRP